MNYYVDSINGDNTNDGLTPSTAIADIFAIDTDADEMATYWVRRGSIFQLAPDATDQITKQFGIIVSYPTAEDDMYDERPQEAIDAGWDDDENVKFKMELARSVNSWNLEDASFVEKLFFHNVELSTKGATAETYMFTIKAPTLTFSNCVFNFESTASSRIIYQGSAGSGITLETNKTSFIGCVDAMSDDASDINYLIASSSTAVISFTKRFLIKDCTFKKLYRFLYISMSTHAYTYEIEIENSKIETSNDCISFRTSYSYATSYLNMHVHSDSSLFAKGNLFYFGNTSYYRVYRGNILLEDSSFVSSSNIFRFYQTTNTTSAEERLDSLIVKRCSFTTAADMLYSHAYSKFRADTILFEDCEFNSSSTIFKLYGSSNSEIEIINPILNGVGDMFYTHASYYYTSGPNIKLKMKNQSLSGSIVDFAESLYIVAEFCSIPKYISTTNTGYVSANIVNSNIGKVHSKTFGTVSIIGSKVKELSDAALKNVSGTIVDSEITCPYNTLFDNDTSELMIESCSISCAALSTPKDGRVVRFLRTTINGVSVPFREDDTDSVLESSPIFRVGGSEFSLLCLLKSYSELKTRSIPNIYGEYISGKNIMSIWISSPNSFIAEQISVFALYIDGGELKRVSLVATDDASQWSGVVGTVTGLKYSVDLADASLIDGQLVRFLVLAKSEADRSVIFNIDTLIKGA